MAAKITGGGRRAPSAGRGGNGRPLTSVDNLSPEEKAKAAAAQRKELEEAEAIQLMSVVAGARPKLAKVEEARAALKLAQDAVNDHFRAAKLESKNFERGRIMELINDSKPESRRDVAHNEAMRARFREIMGLPVGGPSQEELDLHDRLPDVERDGQYWQAVGYTAGVSGGDRDPPLDCVKAGHGNRYDAGWTDGQTILAVNMKKAAAPKAAPAPAAKEETPAEKRKREKAEEETARQGLAAIKPAEVAAQAAADFAADNPEVVTTGEPSPVTAGEPEAGFEASPEELAAQSTRKAVQAAKEGEDATGEIV